MRRLAWAFPGRLCGKNHNLISWLILFWLFQPFLGIGEVSNKISGKIKMGQDTLAYLDGHWDQDIFIKDKATEVRIKIFAHQTRFSVIFTSADKSYLTYPYPIHGIDKKRITICFVNMCCQYIGCIWGHVNLHWLYRRSRNSAVKTLGVDVIGTSHEMSTFSIVEINI